VLGSSSLALPARAELLFRGDMETGDLKQWSYLLKEEGLSVVSEPVAEGKNAGKISITKNELWDNGLNRVEVSYQPADAHVSDGADIYYAYSFYLPEALTSDNHQILYWETNESYQQLMQLAVEGQHMRFATQKPGWKVHWEADNMATPGVWHRVAIHVKWSADANVGQVDLWFDGQQVVTAGKAQTFVGNTAFVQHGILRDTIDKVETMYFDDARAGTTLEDVLAPASMGGGGGGGGVSTAGAGGSGGGTSSGGAPQGGTSGSTPSGGMSSAGTSSAGAPSNGASAGTSTTPSSPQESSASSCGVARDTQGAGGVGLIASLVAASGLARRRRAKP